MPSCRRLAVVLSLSLGPIAAGGPAAAQALSFPMDAAGWTLAPPAGWAGNTAAPLGFARYEGMPTGTLTVAEAIAVSANAQFTSGTIEFDMKPLGYSDAGIIFHRHGNDDGEFVYLRANPDCPAADDCIQYAPITHGLMQWDIYPDEEGPAPIAPQGWNHLRLVVAGGKMAVYVNREAVPSLTVASLQGLTGDGGIAFKGPAVYANLVLRPGIAPALADVQPVAADPGQVTNWLAAPPTIHSDDHPVRAADIPPADAWRAIRAEPTGLVNLSRMFGAAHAPSISDGWLKTVVTATAATRRTLRLGFKRTVSVFLNGRPVFTGENAYYPEARRLAPNGRLEADNASVPLELRQGENEIVLAVGNGWVTHGGAVKASPYGWAAEARFDQPNGLALPRP